MDYTKFLNEDNKFQLKVENNYIKESIQILKDIQKASYILSNHQRFSYKIDLDEYFAYFLKEKNEFIKSFRLYILTQKQDPNTSEDMKKLYTEILSLLKTNLDNLITNFKIVKQSIYKKAKQQERFNEQKFLFIDRETEDERADKENDNQNKINSSNSNKPNKSFKSKIHQFIKNIPVDFEKVEKEIKDRYKESSNILQMFLDKEKQNYEKTKRILYDLSDLMTTVQKKMHEQSEMTKNILINSFHSLDNVKEGNKQLVQAKEYQKGRGLIIGIIFIILGLFLILSDR